MNKIIEVRARCYLGYLQVTLDKAEKYLEMLLVIRRDFSGKKDYLEDIVWEAFLANETSIAEVQAQIAQLKDVISKLELIVAELSLIKESE